MPDKQYSLGEETEQIEFKRSTGELKEAVISMAAILNKHQKGKLYFGVRNDGTVIGQEIGETTMRTVSQTIGNHLSPTIYPTIKKERYGDMEVLSVEFFGTQPPYLAYNIPRIRVADEDLVMEQPTYEEMMRKRDNASYAWERQVSKYNISDIDQSVLKDYLKRAREVNRISFENETPEDVMTKLELCDGQQLLNAGAVLFVNSGMNELQMAKFASDERLTFTDIRRYTGSILDLANKAVQYIVDAMDWRVEFDGSLERKEIPEIPVDAIRESVINAFAHRMIESGQSVDVAIYRSFIEISSPGKFPDGVTPSDFIEGTRRPIRRNPLITRTLYYSKDMESFATGLKRIQEACDEVGCKFECNGDDRGFTVRFYRHCGEGWETGIQYEENGTQYGTQSEASGTQYEEDGTQYGTQSEAFGTQYEQYGTQSEEYGTQSGNLELEDYQIKDQILKMVRENDKVTRKQMSEALSLSPRTVQRLINSMDMLIYVGSGKGGHWEIRDHD